MFVRAAEASKSFVDLVAVPSILEGNVELGARGRAVAAMLVLLLSASCLVMPGGPQFTHG
jgi:hypothetical protein